MERDERACQRCELFGSGWIRKLKFHFRVFADRPYLESLKSNLGCDIESNAFDRSKIDYMQWN
jgi:hypothetical protein